MIGPHGLGFRHALGGVRWRLLGLAALATINGILLIVTLAGFVFADVGGDWYPYWVEAGRRVFGDDLYTWAGEGSYRYSPLLAYFFAAVMPIGYWGWTILHFVALLALPRRVALVAVVSFPFWQDVYNGGVMTFILVAAVAALSGSRIGTVAFLALCLLIPRPLMLPVLAWLLWKRPESRLMLVAVGIVQVMLILASGWGPAWVEALIRVGAQPVGGPADLGPARIIGMAWVPIGLALAAWLTGKGRLGLASLAASPYWLGYYGVMLLLELMPPVGANREAGPPNPAIPHEPGIDWDADQQQPEADEAVWKGLLLRDKTPVEREADQRTDSAGTQMPATSSPYTRSHAPLSSSQLAIAI